MTAAPDYVLALTECVQLVALARATGPDWDHGLPAETLAHRAAILEIAELFERPPEEVAGVYCEVLAWLSGRASVVDFLPVLAAKHVRSRYRLRAEAAPLTQQRAAP
jgi:hypothetical protein